MNFKIIIPARMKSQRFPGKPLAMIAGETLISRVYDKCCDALPAPNVFVATDAHEIQTHCKDEGMNVIMTSDKCRTGTDRVYEALASMELFKAVPSGANIINVQGDEPLIEPYDIIKVMNAFQENNKAVHCAMCPIETEEEFRNVGVPKVVVDENDKLLYMSRGPVPTTKRLEFVPDMAMKQVCIYAFPQDSLYKFYNFGRKSKNEFLEDIEILRFFELGYDIQMVRVSGSSIAVDFPEDVEKVENALKESTNNAKY